MATVPGSQHQPHGPGHHPPFGPGCGWDDRPGKPGPSPGNPGGGFFGPGGHGLNLIGGGFAQTDSGSGNDASGGQPGNDTIGNDTISVSSYETVHGGIGPETINVSGQGDSVSGGGGADTINVFGNYDTVVGGSGPTTINVVGRGDSVTGSTGADTITVFGSYDTIAGGGGADTINAFGHGDAILAGTQPDGAALINLAGTNMTFVDGPNAYNDTIVGFDHAAGDTINLSSSGHSVSTSSQVNGGRDTQIVLSDGSTILLKGVTHIDPSFFS